MPEQRLEYEEIFWMKWKRRRAFMWGEGGRGCEEGLVG
jgi:hypothetical protein